jgi:phytanoyl-CoA hydroxylase
MPMTESTASTSTLNEDSAAFDQSGHVVCRRLISPQRIDALRACVDRKVQRILTALQVDTSGNVDEHDRKLIEAGTLVHQYGRSWTSGKDVEAIYDLHRDGALAGMVGSILGDRVCAHRQYNLRPKMPGQALTTVPWHQDCAYYGPWAQRDRIITTWIPLVPVSAENGCMQIVARPQFELMPHHRENSEGAFLEMDTHPESKVISTVPMMPGDVLIFDQLCWHRSLPNVSSGIRWSIDCRWYGASSPNREALLAGFPQPWFIDGPEAPDAATWSSWYGDQSF